MAGKNPPRENRRESYVIDPASVPLRPSTNLVAGSNTDLAVVEVLSLVLAAFGIVDQIVGVSALGGGHIHHTWSVTVTSSADASGYVLQELNDTVFTNLGACEENLRRIDTHWQDSEITAGIAIPRHLHAVDGAGIHVTLADGSVWRATKRIDDSYTPAQIGSPGEGYQAARAFGLFVTHLRTLPGPPLRETIPRFHDFSWRVHQLRNAVAFDPHGRRSGVQRELDEAEALATQVFPAALSIGTDRTHSVHNDAKVTNLLCHRAGGLPMAVVDLDTTMPGSPLVDLGELVRSGCSARPEDTRDLDTIAVRTDVVTALIDGFTSTAQLSPDQVELVNWGGPVLAVENGMRFLADHLNGDVYFRAHRAGQNLDRARVQLRLARHLLGR